MDGCKVLVTGYTGLLGNALCRQLLKNDFVVYGIARNPLTLQDVKSFSLDLTDSFKLSELVRKLKPSIVFHTAALTNVDYCEEHPEEAYLMNVRATKNVVDACQQNNCLLTYVSTDFVFDGKKGRYSEIDKPNPVNIYGKSKLEGEREILKSKLSYLIVRTSIYGWNILSKQSITEAIVNKLKLNQEFTPFIDQFFTPIYTGTFSRLLLKLIEKRKQGIYNLVADERLSKFDFSQMVAQIFQLNLDLLKPNESNKVQFKAKAERPEDVSLINTKMKEDLKLDRISCLDDLKLMVLEKETYGKN